MTLIELMVVVVILGIIAAIAIPSISGAMNSAKENSTKSDLSTLQEALQRYYVDNNQYPSNLNVLTQATGTGPYVSVTFPENDAYGQPIYYSAVNTSATVTGTGYILLSNGNNGSWSSAPSGNSMPTFKSGQIVATGGQGITPDETPTTLSSTVGPSASSMGNWTDNN